jgi:2-dehydropantoate 2-reductase
VRIGVIGAGALGGLLGGMLARAGHAVSFVARGASLAALRSAGISVSTPDTTFATGPLAASADPADLGPCELVLVTVKSWQVEALAPSLAPLVAAGTLVVPVQNGVEAPDQLARALGAGPVVGGVCHVLAMRDAPGRVRHIGPAPMLTMGEREGGASARLDAVATVLRSAGITAVISDDIRATLWKKLLFVEPFGSVGAVTDSPAEVVRAIPETRAMLGQAMKEVQAVAAGQGVRLAEDTAAQSLARFDTMPVGATTSMHRDLVEGRPSELHEQTGAVVRLGKQAGVARPVHDFLLASLLPREERARRSPART